MARSSLPRRVRRELYAFARRLATPFTDSRRRRFLTDMIGGLVIANHVHLTEVARAIGDGTQPIHGIEKRLSLHLGSDAWDPSPLADRLLHDAAARVGDDTLIVADTSDLAKYYAKKLEGLGRVHDGSDPEKRTAPGYALFEAYVRAGRWQLFPLRVELLKTYAGAATSENEEIIRHVVAIHRAAGGKGTWVLDRGFDRRKLFGPFVACGLAFVARLVGDRNVLAADGRTLSPRALAEEWRPASWPRGRRALRGQVVCRPVRLPEVAAEGFLLVAHFRGPAREPLLLLVSPQARRPRRTGRWYVRAYRRRWGVEDATRGIKQRFQLESFLVRSWRSIARLLWLVAWAFWWLNLWGEERLAPLREALLAHPWRLPKRVIYVFDWIARQVHDLLYPRPIIEMPSG